jgi:uncharacterized membrane protein YeaQ/YmgE (transglycosylase-associated protein family)
MSPAVRRWGLTPGQTLSQLHSARYADLVLGTVIAVMVSAFVTGALARLAVPGPDPMPAWLTVSIGLVGSVVGGAIAAVVSHRDPFAVSLGSFFTAVLLVVAYRRFVQKRPILGPEALRFPRRGVGVQEYRARLKRAGVDPDKLLNRALEQRQPGHNREDDHDHDDRKEDQ